MPVNQSKTIKVTNDNLSDEERENLEKWRKELTDDADQAQEQMQKANRAMRFIYATGGHWEDSEIGDAWENRVKLQFDITSPYKNRFIAEYNSNRFGVEYKPLPDDSQTTKKDAELLTGIRMNDFGENAGKLSQDQAVDELTVCGVGCYEVASEFVDDEDPENEKQKIIYRPVHEAFKTVIWDRASKWINKQDARRCHRLFPFSKEDFEAKYPEANPTSAYQPNDLSWENVDVFNDQLIYIAKRYEVVEKEVDAHVYFNLKNETVDVYFDEDHEDIKDELAADEFIEKRRVRKIKRREIHKTVFSGDDILEKTERIVGKFIPLIPIYAYRGYVDGVEWYHGLIKGLMDPQRLFNVGISQMVEGATGDGQRKPIFAPEQVQGDVGKSWEDLNNAAYALANPIMGPDGQIIHQGPLGYVEANQLDQGVVQLMGKVTEFIREQTGGAPQETLNPATSGKAINALLQRENKNTQPIMENIGNAVEWEGVVYAAMADEIYDTQRMMRVLGKDGSEGEVQLREITVDEETGRPIEANRISGKKFQAKADVGAYHESAREQMVEELKGMLDALSQTEAGQKYTPAVIAMILENITGPGLEPLKKVVRRDMLAQGLAEPQNDEEKEFVKQVTAPKEDPNKELITAAANQANSEARERDSKAAQNVADANKKIAETAKILEDIKIEALNTIAELRKQARENIEGLPLN